MDAVQKDLEARKHEIIKELELLFKANMKITDWDVPEADDKEAALYLASILEEGIEKIKEDIKSGKYTNY